MKKLIATLLVGLFCFASIGFAEPTADKRLGMTRDGMVAFEIMDLCECQTFDDGTEVCVVEEIEDTDHLFQVMDATGDGIGDFTEGFQKYYAEDQLIHVYMGKGPGPTPDMDKQLITELFGINIEENSKTCN